MISRRLFLALRVLSLRFHELTFLTSPQCLALDRSVLSKVTQNAVASVLGEILPTFENLRRSLWWRAFGFARFPTAAVEMMTAGSSDLQTVRKMTSDTPVFSSDCRYTLRLKPQQNLNKTG